MTRIRGIHFNALSEIARTGIPNLLDKPTKLNGMLSMPEELRSLESTPVEINTADRTTTTWTSETAARFYLQTLLENQDSEQLAEITSPERPELIPDMQLERSDEGQLAPSKSVAFTQTSRSIPIFGTRSIVELDASTNRLIAVDGIITDVPNISAIPLLGVPEVIARLSKIIGRSIVDLKGFRIPVLCFYPTPTGEDLNPSGTTEASWHLIYHFRDIPIVATDAVPAGSSATLCCGMSTPFGPVPHDVLVDANSGDILKTYPSATFQDVPVVCTGIDANGNPCTFDGIQVQANKFQLTDPLRKVDTCDAAFADISTTTPPVAPVQHNSTAFPQSSSAAVTAHSLSSLVFDFFNHVLKRHGVDGKGMKLISIVNCYSSQNNLDPHPIWHNAAWWQGKMWYGSTTDASGNPWSTARFLDVMAHELAHGVTNSTASLVYENQSGALNESFSDIFGIMIKNWYPGEPNPLSGWIWTLGDNWHGDGTALRDVQNPTRGLAIWPAGNGQPDHMSKYVRTSKDNGGVHFNSGIHNRAFFNVITATDDTGSNLFSAQEVAILYYLTLTKLAPISGFSDCRRTLLNVVTTRYSGNPVAQAARLKAIRDAYDAVGIS